MARKSRKHNTAQAAMPVCPFISTALYIRLSVEDNNKRGNSIETQKLVLEKFLFGNWGFTTSISTTEQQARISTVTASSGCFRILNPAK